MQIVFRLRFKLRPFDSVFNGLIYDDIVIIGIIISYNKFNLNIILSIK